MPVPPHSAFQFGALLQKCKTAHSTDALCLFDVYACHPSLGTQPSLGNRLVCVLADAGYPSHAQYVFDRLVHREDSSWNSLIVSHAECGDAEHAFRLYEKMGRDSSYPSPKAFVVLLKACITLRDLEKGSKLHVDMSSSGLLERDPFVSSTLIDMYCKCGSVSRAQEALLKLPVRDVVLWTALILGYVHNGYNEEAIMCIEQMKAEGISPDALALIAILKACVNIGSITKGQEIHADVVKKGLEREPVMGNSILDMYAKRGLFAAAQGVFNTLSIKNVVSWTTMIAGYVENGYSQEALCCFQKMQYNTICANFVTFICILKACSSLGSASQGQQAHIEIIKKGVETDDVISNSLVHMYAKCGMFSEAENTFENLPTWSVIACNALLGGYNEHGHAHTVLNCFEWIQCKGMRINPITFMCVLTACGALGDATKGPEVHEEIIKRGLESVAHVGSTLSDMYAKCGLLEEAQALFDKLHEKDIVAWTALVTGYVEHGYIDKSLECLEKMQNDCGYLNSETFICILKAYSNTCATEKVHEIHSDIVKRGWEIDMHISGMLIHTYAKCGSAHEAKYAFDELPAKDDVCWNAVIATYAQVGESQNVFHLYEEMCTAGMKPDFVTFVSVLNAYSHAGQIDTGESHFEAIGSDYGLTPTMEHYIGMIDLLGRGGCVEKAFVVLNHMPMQPNKVAWLTVLGACRKWSYVELGRYSFEHAVQLDEKDRAPYICMFNIYSDATMQVEARRIETMGLENQVLFKSGELSLTDISPQCFAFLLE